MTTFETAGRTQTIREGGPDGEIVGRSVWTPGGPEFDATVQPAFAPLVVAPAIIIGGAVLFGWQSPFNGDDGQQAVIGFNARDFRPSETTGSALDLSYVGQIDQAAAEAACKYLPELHRASTVRSRQPGRRTTTRIRRSMARSSITP